MTEQLRFDGRVAIITGGGTGLGRSHARLLASRGAKVVINDLAGPPGGESVAQRVADEIEASGGVACAHEADISVGAEARGLVDYALKQFGCIDILVNNAGLLRTCDFSEMTEELLDRVLTVSLRGTILVSHAAWSTMKQRGYGRILSTTSNSGLFGTAGSTAYAAAKAGIWGFTRSLALEGALLGIQVNAIAPIAYTAMSAKSRVAPASWRSREGDAWARRLDVAQVSQALAWLAHEDCQLNGEIWSIAGGRVARCRLGTSQGFDVDALTPEEVRDRESEILSDTQLDFFESSAREGKALHKRLMR